MSGESIMIVEDESLVAQDLEKTLTRLGYEVTDIVDTGEDAIEAVENNELDLILMDIKLNGEMDGIQASREIQSRFDVPIIYLTAHMDDKVLNEAKKTEPFAYIKKPFSSESLRSSIEVALEKHRNLKQERKAFEERIEQAKEEKEREIEYLAYHDPLTDLPNRFSFQQLLQEELEESIGTERDGAVLFLDLIGFQHLNDAFGHSFGDRVLSQLAGSFKERLPDKITIARWGGDVFTLLIPDCKGRDEIETHAEVIFDILGFPYEVQDNQLQIECSIGAALYPEHGISTEELISKADIALFESKKKSGNSLNFYSEGGKQSIQERVQKTSQLRQSIEDQSFDVVYQPVYTADNNEIKRVEALARWNHPSGEQLTGGAFIPVAESSGLIIELGDLIMKQACETAAQWEEEFGWSPQIAVNVSTKQLLDKSFKNTIEEALDQSGLSPEQLELEITETTLMTHIDRAVDVLESLCDYGINIAIDDFGTGYSSLKYLIPLPITTIKIDRYFTSRVNKRKNMLDLIEVIHILSNRFDLNTVIEGVETEEQKEMLEPYCDEMQGYLFSYPLPSEEISEGVAKQHGGEQETS